MGRYPVYEEIRYMAYMGIVLGAKGVVFVCYQTEGADGTLIEDIGSKANPKVWQDVSRVSSELRDLVRVLPADNRSPEEYGVLFEGADSLEVTVKLHGGQTWLLTANPNEKPIEGRIVLDPTVHPEPKVTEWPHGREVMVQDGRILEAWDTWGVHVYRIADAGSN